MKWANIFWQLGSQTRSNILYTSVTKPFQRESRDHKKAAAAQTESGGGGDGQGSQAPADNKLKRKVTGSDHQSRAGTSSQAAATQQPRASTSSQAATQSKKKKVTVKK